jgi:enterochelin esterase family protein
MTDVTSRAPKRAPRKLAINRLRERPHLDAEMIDRFTKKYRSPIIEGERATFLFRGHADEVRVRHRVVGLPDPLPLRRIRDTDLWAVTTELPQGSRVEYQLETRHGEHYERFNDPLNPRVAHSPMGSSSVCAAIGYAVPEWVHPDPEARPGELVTELVQSKALRREQPVHLYLPARFNRAARYTLLVVHDGTDYLGFTAMKTVLDNLIHRLDIAPMLVAFVPPRDRLKEYPNHAPHARFIARELVPLLTERFPLQDSADGRTLMGSSFGGIASLSTAVRYPGLFGSLFLQSASLVFTDIGMDHGGGSAFDPVVKFVNRYRAKPTAPVERIFMTCGTYEPLITPNRSMVPVFRGAGMTVKYTEARDGHNWENWRDQLRDGLSWLHPGPQLFVYE